MTPIKKDLKKDLLYDLNVLLAESFFIQECPQNKQLVKNLIVAITGKKNPIEEGEKLDLFVKKLHETLEQNLKNTLDKLYQSQKPPKMTRPQGAR